MRHFADICGYLGEIRPAEEKRESLSKVGLKLALKINRLDLPGVARNKIIRLLKADLPKNKYGKATFKQKLDRQFYLKYDHSNRRVFEEYVSEDYRYIYDKYYAPND